MKVGILFRNESGGGVTKFLTNLILEMSKRKDIDLYVFTDETKTKDIFPKIKIIYIPKTNLLIWDYIKLPIHIQKERLEVVIFPKDIIPPIMHFFKIKKVVISHDLGYFIKSSGYYPLKDTLYRKIFMNYSLRNADRIIAVSKNTKSEILNYFSIPQKKIEIIYEGVEKRYKKKNNPSFLDKIRQKYNLNRTFIFYSGSISPRKNLFRLIKAFEKIQEKTNCELVIAGNKMWNNKKEMEIIRKNSKIKILGFVPEEDLVALYNLAEVYVYPSLYEGFGLPILEAQACGCPVITSNVSSMPEVAGKGAVLVNPHSVNEIADAMEKVLKDKKLRDKLIKEGYKNVKRFSWEKCARETLKLCEEVYNEK